MIREWVDRHLAPQKMKLSQLTSPAPVSSFASGLKDPLRLPGFEGGFNSCKRKVDQMTNMYA